MVLAGYGLLLGFATSVLGDLGQALHALSAAVSSPVDGVTARPLASTCLEGAPEDRAPASLVRLSALGWEPAGIGVQVVPVLGVPLMGGSQPRGPCRFLGTLPGAYSSGMKPEAVALAVAPRHCGWRCARPAEPGGRLQPAPPRARLPSQRLLLAAVAPCPALPNVGAF